MTTQTTELFERTMLSEAAYANFRNIAYTDQNVRTALINSGRTPFSEAQAKLLTDHWRVIHHQPDNSTGFSATLFQSKQDPDKYVLATRGTNELFEDLALADIQQIFLQGAALDQIVALYNYWQYLNAAPGQSYQRATLESTAVAVEGVPVIVQHDFTLGSRHYGLRFTDVVQTDDVAGRPGPEAALTIAGHSLGGHLAFAFDRLFAGAGAEAFSVNGAGFRESDGLSRFFDVLAGQSGTQFDHGGLNIHGTEGPEVITRDDGILRQQGGHAGVFTENEFKGFPSYGHSVAHVTDTLSVQDLFIRLDETLAYADPAIVFTRLNPIFEAASAAPDFSIERVVNALGKLILGESFTPIAESEEDAREPLYQAVTAIREALYDESGALRPRFSGLAVVSLAGDGASAEALLSWASEDSAEGHAYRYALAELNPFVIVGGEDLYPENPSVPAYADYSESYWRDRAAFVLSVIAAGANDSVRGDGTLLDSGADYDRTFEDADRDIRLRYPRAMENLPYTNEVTFSDAVWTEGDRGTDRLYGGASANTLLGGLGADHLEGGTGDDVLYGNDLANTDDGAADVLVGGAGQDVYYAGRGDTVVDEDGTGVIYLRLPDGTPIEISNRTYVETVSGVYCGDDGQIKLVLQADGTLNVKVNPSITIAGFESGDFGIELAEFNDPTARTAFSGTTGDDEFRVNYGDIPITNAANEVQALAGNDDVWSGDGDDRIDGGEGNDFVYGEEGTDHVLGGAGDDILIGAFDDDVLEGGDGSDILVGDHGNFDTDGGDDVLDGGAGSDLLLGGDGEDVLLGGDGNDLILVNGYGTPGVDSTFREVGDDWEFSAWNFFPEPTDPVTGRIVPIRQSAGVAFGGAGDDDLYGGESGDRLAGDDGDDLIHAGDGDDVVSGGAGADLLIGDGGADLIEGGAGDDRVWGGDSDGTISAYTTQPDGGDAIDAGAGDDTVHGGEGDDVINGGEGNDRLQGDAGDDTIWGGSGNDLILGNAGNDILAGDAGDDQVSGHDGDDALNGGDGDDLLVGEAGNDVLDGGEGHDRLGGGAGNDVMSGGSGWDVIHGDEGDDALAGDAGNDYLFGRQGIDTLSGGAGDDWLEGGDDNDDLAGDAGDDVVLAGMGDDTAAGGAGNDRLQGGAGRDVLSGEDGDDTLAGEDGDDQLLGGAGDDHLDGGAGVDSIAGGDGNDQVLAGADADSISGGAGDDRLDGGDGNDAITGDDGDDVLWGGTGIDTLAGGAGNDFLDGGADADSLTAGDGRDVLYGGAGGDAIDGGDGSDQIAGDAGDDAQNGGSDHDTFIYATGDGADTIVDSAGFDTLRFNAAILVQGSITIAAAGADLDFVIDAEQRVRIADWATNAPIDAIVFGDGTVLTRDNFLSGANTGRLLRAEGGENTLSGTAGTDIFEVNGTRDVLDGGAGDDAYLIDEGQTVKMIHDDAGADTLVLGDGIGVDDVALSMRDGDVTILAGAARIEIPDWQNNTIERIVLSDGTVLDTIAIAARINRAPVVVNPVADLIANEDEHFVFTVPENTFADPDDATLDYAALRADGLPLPYWLSFDPDTRTFSGIPGSPDVGDVSIDVWAIDSAGSATPVSLNIDVHNINDAPTNASPLPDRVVTEGFAFTWTLPYGHFMDADNSDTLSYRATRADGMPLPSWLNFNAETRTFTGVPTDADVGTALLKIEARDAAGATAVDEFEMTVVDSGMEAAKTVIRGGVRLRSNIYSAGLHVSGASDINGDGFDDLLIGSRVWEQDGVVSCRGEAYVVFGRADGLPGEMELSSLNGINGFSILGPLTASDELYPNAAGDMDGDGLADIVVGRLDGTDGLLVKGSMSPRSSTVTFESGNLRNIGGVEYDPETGEVEDYAGTSLIALGDVNNDGFSDIGARGLWMPGRTFVMYGQSRFSPSNARTLLTGFDEGLGMLGAAGDVNGDRFSDILVWTSNGIHVVYGSAAMPQILGMSALDGINSVAFTASAQQSASAQGIGDINGDGFADLAFQMGGDVHVLYGSDAWGSTVDLDTWSGGAGFTIDGACCPVAVGDIDGDGIAEFAVRRAEYGEEGEEGEEAVIIYGSAEPRQGTFAIAEPSSSEAFIVDAGAVIGSIAGAGDINGDGYADLILGTPGAGDRMGWGRPGAALVVYGRDFRGRTTSQGIEGDDVVVLDGNLIRFAGRGGDDNITLNGTGTREVTLGTGHSMVTVRDVHDGVTNFRITSGNGTGRVVFHDFQRMVSYILRTGATSVTTGPEIGPDAVASVLRWQFEFADVPNASSISLGLGSLKVSIPDRSSEIHFESFDPEHVLEGPRDFDSFRFGDGSVLSYEALVSRGFDIPGTDGNDTLRGTSVTDRIDGGLGDDTIDGGRGDDEITGGAGNDTLSGGAGNDVFLVGEDSGLDQYEGGDGFDTIRGGSGNDTIRLDGFGAAAAIEAIDGAGGSDLVLGSEGADLFDFSAVVLLGDVTLHGGGGDDVISGSWGDDRIDGGSGNDVLDGGPGDDTFLLSGAWGADRVVDVEGVNTVLFSAEVSLSDLTVSQSGDDLIIDQESNRLTIDDWFTGDEHPISTFQFSEGTTVSAASMESRIGLDPYGDIPWGSTAIIFGTNANDTLIGNENRNWMFGVAGNDRIEGLGGDDVITGGAGRDTMFGGDGNDVFLIEGSDTQYDRVNGGAGTDRVLGGAGDDTIVLHDFEGEDTVEIIDGGAGTNRVAGTSANDRIDLAGTTQIRIARIDGLGGNDIITGSVAGDVINGGPGTDKLRGGAGNDCYEFDWLGGTDRIHDSAGADDRVSFGSGIARGRVWFSRAGDDLRIDLVGSADVLFIEDWYDGVDYRVERFEADGSLLHAAQVEQLVQAMSAYALPSNSEPLLPPEVADAVMPVIASAWQAAA